MFIRTTQLLCKKYKAVPLSMLALCAVVLIAGPGCSSSGGSSAGNGSGSTALTETVALGSAAKNVQLVANQEKQFVLSYTYPADTTALGDFSIDMVKTLQNVSLSSSPISGKPNIFETLYLLASGLVAEAFAADSAQVTVHISYAGDPNVCSSPYFGQDTILGAIGSPVTGSKTRVELPGVTRDIINAGGFDLCVVTTPPIDAYVTLTGVVVDVQPCEAANIDITGTWSGTYECVNSGYGNESGDVTLTITKNPDGSYHYADGQAEYDGHLCGSKFRFKGGSAGQYTESGTMVFNGTSASKTSLWQSSVVSGRCTDSLQKI